MKTYSPNTKPSRNTSSSNVSRSEISKSSPLSKRKPSTALENKVQKKNNPTSRLSEYDFTTTRFQVAASLFLLAWVLIWFRAFYIQLIAGPELAEKASRQHMYTEIVEAKRGTIYDRNYLPLARSIEARSIYANPRAMKNPLDTASKLAEITGLNVERLNELFLRDKAFVWVSRKVDDSTAKRVQDAKLEGIGFSREYDRIYPQKHLAGQLLGFVGIDNQGLEGVERSFDTALAGESSKRIIYKDGDGRRYYMDGQDAPQGDDILLTIDSQVQYIAEEVIAEAVKEYNAKWGGVLIAEVETGEVLAWAQYPFFNPNDFRNASPQIYRNRIAADALEPGSTLKPFPVAAALEEGIITPETIYFCENGTWETKYITIRDDGRNYADLKANEIMKFSSNIGVAKIGLDLGVNKYYNYLSQLGFGLRTEIGIGESKGIVRAPKDWTEVDLMTAAFGQSVSVTGLQMTQAYLTLANKGIFKPLKLTIDKNEAEPVEQRIFSEKTTNEIMQMLEDVVEGDGTGTRARIENVPVAGKTGTAQKASKDNVAGYGEDRFASFVGIVPSDAPRYVVLVMLDEPQTNQYGGRIAAPAFSEVASRVLAFNGYIPDMFFGKDDDDERSSKAESQAIKTREVKNTGKLTTFPDLIGASLRSSLEVLIPNGIEPEIRGTGLTVLYQFPAPGTPLPLVDENGKNIPVVVWLDDEEIKAQQALEAQNAQTQQNSLSQAENSQTQTNASNTTNL